MGIIGGADGPAAVFVGGSPVPLLALAVLAAAVFGAAVWLLRK